MKRQIRRGVFETNSSSTHSLTMCMKSDYDKWSSGEYYNTDNVWGLENNYEPSGQFVSKEEAIELLKHYKYVDSDLNYDDEDEVNSALRDAGFKSFDDIGSELESFYDEFTTPNGDVVVSFGEYGYDG